MHRHRIAFVNSGQAAVQAETLRQRLTLAWPELQTDAFNGLDAFFRALRRPEKTYYIVVFSIGERRVLIDLVANRHWFGAIKVIVVLARELHALLPVVHQLAPRYIAYPSEAFSDLVAVVGQMVIANPNRKAGSHARRRDAMDRI